MKAEVVLVKEFGQGILIEAANIILIPVFNQDKKKIIITTWDASLVVFETTGKEADIEASWYKLAKTLDAVMKKFDDDGEKIADSIAQANLIFSS